MCHICSILNLKILQKTFLKNRLNIRLELGKCDIRAERKISFMNEMKRYEIRQKPTLSDKSQRDYIHNATSSL